MFTGLVEQIGRVQTTARQAGGMRITVQATFSDLSLGESISVSGVCLTVIQFDKGQFVADVSTETLRATTLGTLRAGDSVNLERALPANARLGGHFVLGHIDGTAELIAIEPSGPGRVLKLRATRWLAPFVAPKGSIALEGVSLTVNEVVDAADSVTLSVMIVPHTWGATTFSSLRVGEQLNVEIDPLARYVARSMACRDDLSATSDASMLETLKRAGRV